MAFALVLMLGFKKGKWFQLEGGGVGLFLEFILKLLTHKRKTKQNLEERLYRAAEDGSKTWGSVLQPGHVSTMLSIPQVRGQAVAQPVATTPALRATAAMGDTATFTPSPAPPPAPAPRLSRTSAARWQGGIFSHCQAQVGTCAWHGVKPNPRPHPGPAMPDPPLWLSPSRSPSEKHPDEAQDTAKLHC